MFRETEVYSLKKSPFEFFGSDWAILTAKNAGGEINAMTISWGAMGVLWNKNVFFCFVRPTRHTFSFIESGSDVSLCFFDGKYKEALAYCGRVSGRDTEKIKASGLTPNKHADGVYYSECSLALLGQKIYSEPLKEGSFWGIDPSEWYKNDFHTMYVCEIKRVLTKK